DGKLRFSSGITTYPHMGAIAHRIRAADLATIYTTSLKNTVSIGHLSQNADIPALISVDSLISRHFAVL
ncbi:ATP-binding protein, partial [Escherichia coli]|nr:ATP-binding protein [Escherichia coli]